MDVATIDQQYQLLEQEGSQLGQLIDVLASKMQGSGDDRTKEWLLDLKSIALQMQQEQLQVQSLLQALHGFVVNTLQPPPAPSYEPPVAPPPQYQAAQPASYAAPPASSFGQGPQRAGVLSRFTGSNFGQSMSSGVGMGVGFGLADSLINSIFGR